MDALIFIVGILLAWPGALLLAGHARGDVRSRMLPVAIVLCGLALLMIAHGVNRLGASGGLGAMICGSGPTAFDC